MRLDPGTIAHWQNFKPGVDKFIYILGTSASGDVLSFTISSQTKYLSLKPHADEMVEIPYRQTSFLCRRSFIQCFHYVTRTPVADFRALEKDGSISWRACLPEFIPKVVEIMGTSQLLPEHDIEDVLETIGRCS